MECRGAGSLGKKIRNRSPRYPLLTTSLTRVGVECERALEHLWLWTVEVVLRMPLLSVGGARRAIRPHFTGSFSRKREMMNRIIWVVGAIVIVLFILGFLGLR